MLQAAGLQGGRGGQRRHADPARGARRREPYDVLAVELSSFQLHWLPDRSLGRPLASAVLNVAPDHVDWHGSLEAYLPTRARSTSAPRWPASTTCRTRAPSSWSGTPTSRRAAARSASPSARRRSAWSAWWRTCWSTGRSSTERRTSAAELGTLADVRALAGLAPHNVANALAAAALARAVRRGAGRGPGRACAASGPTRTASRTSATVDGVSYVDDSKATNPHAAAASLAAFEHVVWVAGGLLKGARRRRPGAHARPRGCAGSC